MLFNEDFLSFIWKFRLYEPKVQLVSGESLEVMAVGFQNQHAGPDFENAKLRIGGTLWAGCVEIHINSSDWIAHNHTDDKAYDNVVLHVVYEYDRPVFRSDGTEVPVLELKGSILPDILNRYQGLMENLSWVSCEKQLAQVEDIYVGSWLSRVLIERLEEKSKLVYHTLEQNKGSWDDAFYVLLARNFGFKVNALPFEMLANSLPQQVLAKHKNNQMQIEALVFGQAGFLAETADEFQTALYREYAFLRNKYQLKPIQPHLWKFLRLRPQNFPTLRLAQFAALVVKSHHLFSRILEIDDVRLIARLFQDLPVNGYWDSHYRFGLKTEHASGRLGADSVNNIILNSIAVSLFSYGRYMSDAALTERAVRLLETLPFETNQITRRFLDMGVGKGNADRSQALLQLKKTYCDRKKCLTCAIGARIVNAE